MQTLFTSDRMIVQGEAYDSVQSGTNSPTIKTPFIRLNFIFQVNGKMTQFGTTMELDGESLKDWNPWNSIAELFLSMGYNFSEGESSKLQPAYHVVKQWVIKSLNHPDYSYQGNPGLYENATVENCT